MQKMSVMLQNRPLIKSADLADYVHIRGGLGAIRESLQSRSCGIAYFGSSVTSQKKGFRPRLQQRIRSEWGAHHREIHAAFPGASSSVGLFLMPQNLLCYSPDLCFIDFSVSDTLPPTRMLETIVKKLLRQGCVPCFVYSYRQQVSSDYEAVLHNHELIAGYYGIPSVNIGAYLHRQMASGELSHDDVFRDEVHTNDETGGGDYVGDLLFHAMQILLRGQPTEQHCLQKNDESSLYECDAVCQEFMFAQPEHFADRHAVTGTQFQNYCYYEMRQGNQIRLPFCGRLLGLCYVAGPSSGVIRIDHGSTSDEYCLWDQHCHYDRFHGKNIEMITSDGDGITISLVDTPIDYSLCRRQLPDMSNVEKTFRVIGYMIERPVLGI